MSGHLDLDELADALAGDGETPAHLASCEDCRAALDELREVTAGVAAELAALPALTLPSDVAGRIAAALSDEESVPVAGSATVTTLPPARTEHRQRWLPAAAAAVLLLGGAGYGLSQLGGSESSGSGGTSAARDSAAKGAPELDVVRNSTGTDYSTRATLAAALPDLLAGTAGTRVAAAPAAPAAGYAGGAAPRSTAPDSAESQSLAAADPLARLRDDVGLAECLLALLPPDDPSVRPLALDYASFKGAPALVVVLPSPLPRKLDVFVVGPGCSRANDSTLFYTSVDRP